MSKVYQLDPQHEHLLNDHSSGYWWIRSLHPANKYKGTVIFTMDFGESLRKSALHKIRARRLHGQLIKFKIHGYVFSRMEFIKLIDCDDQDRVTLDQAKAIKQELVTKLKREARAIAIRKTIATKYGPSYKGPKRKKKSGPTIERKLWVWKFQNKELGKKFHHIFTFIDDGVPIGKSRGLFADYYGLQFKQLQLLAAGKIKAHRGWTLIGKPLRITYREAIAMKIKELSQIK